MMRLVSRAFCSGRGGLSPLLRAAPAATGRWQQGVPAAQCSSLQLQPQGAPAARASVQWQHRSVAARASRGKAAAGGTEEAPGEDEEGESDDDLLEDLEGLEEDVGPEVSTGNLDWGEAALAVTRKLLGEDAAFEGIELFSLRAIASGKRLDIRLDKTSDLFGSPSLDDIEAFSRAFNAALEAALGEAAAGEIEVEVSSPGAERMVRIPWELERFAELPMKVESASSEDGAKVESRVLQLEEYDEEAGVSRWRLADVRANRAAAGKGRGLNKKQRETVIEIPAGALRRVNLHLDL